MSNNIKLWIVKQIGEIERDERYHYEPADVFINAPLALIQVDLKSRMRTLKQALAVLMKAEENEK